MGNGSDKLIFRTLKLVYGIDGSKIIRNPELFEEKLIKILGDAKVLVIDSVKGEISDNILYKTKLE
jgi:hypothetical protein